MTDICPDCGGQLIVVSYGPSRLDCDNCGYSRPNEDIEDTREYRESQHDQRFWMRTIGRRILHFWRYDSTKPNRVRSACGLRAHRITLTARSMSDERHCKRCEQSR